jgi:choline kinase
MTRGVILAAGVASRLRPLTDTKPKCLIEVGGKTILERTINNLVANGITEIVIVTGYLDGRIRSFIDSRFPRCTVTIVQNERYETTNNIYSLWLARDQVRGDELLLLDSDILFDQAILGLLLKSPHPDCLALRSDHALGPEEIKVQVDGAGMVRSIGKEVDPGFAAGESIGIERFGTSGLDALMQVLDRMILREQKEGFFYEAAFQEFINAGHPMAAVNVGSLRCIEIDTPEDLEAAARDVARYLD